MDKHDVLIFIHNRDLLLLNLCEHNTLCLSLYYTSTTLENNILLIKIPNI